MKAIQPPAGTTSAWPETTLTLEAPSLIVIGFEPVLYTTTAVPFGSAYVDELVVTA